MKQRQMEFTLLDMPWPLVYEDMPGQKIQLYRELRLIREEYPKKYITYYPLYKSTLSFATSKKTALHYSFRQFYSLLA